MRVHPDKTALRAVDACGGTYSAEECASGFAAGHTKALCDAMAAVVDADTLTAGLLAALEEIADLEPAPFVGGLDIEAIKACGECQRYVGHPVQGGICNTHRRPIWDREAHDSHEEKALGYRAMSIARAAITKATQGLEA